jgi:hypothetical protein
MQAFGASRPGRTKCAEAQLIAPNARKTLEIIATDSCATRSQPCGRRVVETLAPVVLIRNRR